MKRGQQLHNIPLASMKRGQQQTVVNIGMVIIILLDLDEKRTATIVILKH